MRITGLLVPLFLAMTAGAPFSYAQTLAATYSCSAEANPEGGFPVPFAIQADDLGVGGHVRLARQSGQISSLGVIKSIRTFQSDDRRTDERLRFQITLAALAGARISGVSEKLSKSIKTIAVYKVTREGRWVASIYRLSNARRQLGGALSLPISGSAKFTACLPR